MRFGTASNGVKVTWSNNSDNAVLVRKIHELQLRIARLGHFLCGFIVMRDGENLLIRCEECRPYPKTCAGYKAGCVYCHIEFAPYLREVQQLRAEKHRFQSLLQEIINREVIRKGVFVVVLFT